MREEQIQFTIHWRSGKTQPYVIAVKTLREINNWYAKSESSNVDLIIDLMREPYFLIPYTDDLTDIVYTSRIERIQVHSK